MSKGRFRRPTPPHEKHKHCSFVQYYWQMAKEKTHYVCTECGGSSPKWLGKCPSCNAWNTLIESAVESAGAGS